MNNKYKDILDSLKEDTTPKHINDRILIIDGLNTFIRSFAVNPSTNEDGIHIGGMTGFLHSIGYAIRNIKPTRVIICFDGKGGSQKRRKLFPNYKSSRRVKHRMTRINEFNSVLCQSCITLALLINPKPGRTVKIIYLLLIYISNHVIHHSAYVDSYGSIIYIEG